MNPDIQQYNNAFSAEHKAICVTLSKLIDKHLSDAESKIWHANPVWFINGNPIVGYSLQKRGIRLMFWSGADFEAEKLDVRGKKFKDASIFFQDAAEINPEDMARWLDKARAIQWDYKNIIKRRGKLERIS
jgi:uncharacterized protein YdhG (YjbR/CyaY superfamily)